MTNHTMTTRTITYDSLAQILEEHAIDVEAETAPAVSALLLRNIASDLRVGGLRIR